MNATMDVGNMNATAAPAPCVIPPGIIPGGIEIPDCLQPGVVIPSFILDALPDCVTLPPVCEAAPGETVAPDAGGGLGGGGIPEGVDPALLDLLDPNFSEATEVALENIFIVICSIGIIANFVMIAILLRFEKKWSVGKTMLVLIHSTQFVGIILLLVPFLVVRGTAGKIFNIYLPGWNDECVFPAVAAQFLSLMEPLWLTCLAHIRWTVLRKSLASSGRYTPHMWRYVAAVVVVSLVNTGISQATSTGPFFWLPGNICSRIDIGDYYPYIYPISFLIGGPYIGYCYYKVIQTMRTQMADTAVLSGTERRSAMEERRRARTQEAMNVLIMLTALFYLAHLPFFVEFVSLFWADHRLTDFTQTKALICVKLVFSAFAPVVTIVFTKRYRDDVPRLLAGVLSPLSNLSLTRPGKGGGKGASSHSSRSQTGTGTGTGTGSTASARHSKTLEPSGTAYTHSQVPLVESGFASPPSSVPPSSVVVARKDDEDLNDVASSGVKAKPELPQSRVEAKPFVPQSRVEAKPVLPQSRVGVKPVLPQSRVETEPVLPQSGIGDKQLVPQIRVEAKHLVMESAATTVDVRVEREENTSASSGGGISSDGSSSYSDGSSSYSDGTSDEDRLHAAI